MTDGVELWQGSVDMSQYRPTTSGQPNPRMPTFKECETELVLEPLMAGDLAG